MEKEKRLVNKEFYLLIPTLNEEANIEFVLKKAIQIREIKKIVIIDGGSIDKTLDIASKYSVDIIKQESKGKGGAIIESLDYFTPDSRVFIIDGDASYDPDDILLLLPELKPGILVNGSRLIKEIDRESMTWFHKFGNKFINFFFNKIYKSNMTDVLSGMKGFIVRDLKSLDLQTKNFEIEAEIMSKAIQKLKIIEIPIKYLPREGGTSKLSPIKDGFKIIRRIYKESRKKDE